jgi:glycerol uptake facilitator-like aquaporin
MNKKLLAEIVGTALLSLIVSLSGSGGFVLTTPLLAALTLTFLVYTIGHISGCHINPAVTIGLWHSGKIEKDEAFRYIASQFAGGIFALNIASIIGRTIYSPATLPSSSYLFEFLGTAVFAFGIASVVYNHHKSMAGGIIIGGSLLLGIAVASLGGAPGILNPAVALSLKSTNLGLYVAELVGAVAGFKLYQYLNTTK